MTRRQRDLRWMAVKREAAKNIRLSMTRERGVAREALGKSANSFGREA